MEKFDISVSSLTLNMTFRVIPLSGETTECMQQFQNCDTPSRNCQKQYDQELVF